MYFTLGTNHRVTADKYLAHTCWISLSYSWYINCCHVSCYSHWVLGNHSEPSALKLMSTWSSSILAQGAPCIASAFGFPFWGSPVQSYTQQSPRLRWSVWTLASCTGSGLSIAIVPGAFSDSLPIVDGGEWARSWTQCWEGLLIFFMRVR